MTHSRTTDRPAAAAPAETAAGTDRKTASEAAGERKRLAALRGYDVLDTAPEESFDRITRLAKSMLDVPIVLVSLVDENRQWFKSCIGLDVSETPRGISFCTHAIQSHGPLIVPDTRQDARFRDNPLVTGGPTIRFYAGVPLRTPGGQNIGTLCAIDTVPRTLTDDQIGLFRDLARLVVDEMELRRLAATDPLTGVQTRRAFLHDFAGEIERARRYHRSIGLIAFEIDDFPSVAATHGPAAGDVVLQSLAALCRKGLRAQDRLGRLGPGRFMIVLPETGLDQTAGIAERTRRRIAETPATDGDRRIAVTASFGVAAYAGGSESPDALREAAETAIGTAQAGGGNRTAVDGRETALPGAA